MRSRSRNAVSSAAFLHGKLPDGASVTRADSSPADLIDMIDTPHGADSTDSSTGTGFATAWHRWLVSGACAG